MPSSQAFAPGKVILLGEHAVVYGQPAIALPLDRGVTVTCTPAPTFTLRAPAAGSGSVVLADAVLELANALGSPSVAVEIESSLPVSAGLGSSAAVAVASVRALAQAASKPIEDVDVVDLAEGMEKHFHGRPSGIDHTTSFYARPLRLRRGPPREVEHLDIPKLELVIALAEPRTGGAKAHIAAVHAGVRDQPDHFDPLIRDIGLLAEAGAKALAAGALLKLGAMMNVNHRLLQRLGVSTPGLDALVAKMIELGSFGAKLTGAGGGGAAIALHPEPQQLVTALRDAGHTAFVSTWEQR